MKLMFGKIIFTLFAFCLILTACILGDDIETLQAKAKAGAEERENALRMNMVYVQGGTFDVGKNLGTGGGNDEWPMLTATLSNFYIGKYEVTQEQYQAITGKNPSDYKNDSLASGEVQAKRPVENLSWYDAIEFCNALSEKEGLTPYYTIDKTKKDPNNTNNEDPHKWTITLNNNANGYRLPTSAQWEYAAKGGNPAASGWVPYTYPGSNTPSDISWYKGNSEEKTHEVGKKTPNKLGIHDMSGNVWEFCWDWDWYGNDYLSGTQQTNPTGPTSGSRRVARGGSYWDDNNRSVIRGSQEPASTHGNHGFRVVCPIGISNLNSVKADGSSNQTTTQLTLTFSSAITGLTANDITLTGVSGVVKGKLSGSNPYTLPISGFVKSGTLTVAVTKTGYNLTGSLKNVDIYFSGGEWNSWADTSFGITIKHSVDKEGVCTVTVGGTAQQDSGKANVSFKYNAQEGKRYKYEFEAWTDGGERTLGIFWFENGDDQLWIGNENNQLTINSTRKTYTLTADKTVPRHTEGEGSFMFLCANQTGTFHVKMISIALIDG